MSASFGRLSAIRCASDLLAILRGRGGCRALPGSPATPRSLFLEAWAESSAFCSFAAIPPAAEIAAELPTSPLVNLNYISTSQTFGRDNLCSCLSFG